MPDKFDKEEKEGEGTIYSSCRSHIVEPEEKKRERERERERGRKREGKSSPTYSSFLYL
jgi:hypothetical protein